jgi:hypothetical protein
VNTIAEPRTAGDVLFGGEQRVVMIADALVDSGVVDSVGQAVQRMSSTGQGIVGREVAAMTDSLLSLDIGDILLVAWRKRATLVDAARRTLVEPGSSATVELASHRITHTSRPHVDLLVDGVLVHRFDLELSMVLEVGTLVAVVRSGRLAELGTGDCRLTCSLGIDGFDIAKRTTRLDISRMVRLGAGIPLLERAMPAGSG